MTGVVFRFDLDAQVAVGQLAGIQAFYGDLTPLLHDIGNEGEQSTINRFDTNVSPDGVPWEPSLRATLTGTRTLVMTRDLQDSINYQLDGDTVVEWGSGLIYAAIHQGGGTITAKTAGGLAFSLANGNRVVVQSVEMPAREYLGLSPMDQTEILDIVGRHIAAAAQAGVSGPGAAP
jgi:phage gpG-like protein